MKTHFRIKSFFKIAWLFILGFAAALVLSFQNCGNVRVAPVEERSPSTLEAISQGVLPPPLNIDAPLRVVFLVDQSHSNKFAGCDTDLDGENPHPRGPVCDEGDGTDPLMMRFAMIKLWLDYLKWANYGATTAANIKLAIVPFTGGFRQFKPPPGGYVFGNLEEAYSKLEELKQMQTIEPVSGEAAKKMGTTVPLKPIEEAYSMVDKEMVGLAEAEILENSTFEIVFITDGYLKPYEALLKKALELAECPTNCATNPNQEACQPSGTEGWKDGVDPYTFCHAVLPQQFSMAFGSYADNTPEQVANALKGFSALPAKHAGGTLKVRLVQTEYAPPGPNNTLDMIPDIVTKMVDDPNFKKYKVSSVQTPFVIQPKLLAQLSYVVQQFYVVGLNARVNELGKLVIDSDGDGISDQDEKDLGWDFLNPRSSVNGGKCVDGIFNRYGCEKKRLCDPLLDDDADGLNQCEEMTLNTLEDKSDTDEDEILDFYESLGMGLNPNQNEVSKHASEDLFGDHQHFSAGVHTQFPLDQVSSDDKINFQVNAIGTTISRSASGAPVKMTSYKILVPNLPMVPTKATNYRMPELMTTLKKGQKLLRVPLPNADLLIGTPHAEGVNQFVFVIKMTSLENPDASYWLMQKREVVYDGQRRKSIELDLSQFHHLIYLK